MFPFFAIRFEIIGNGNNFWTFDIQLQTFPLNPNVHREWNISGRGSLFVCLLKSSPS